MNRLRGLFLAPVWLIAGSLLFAPLVIVFLYSLLTRGAYGGLAPPWNFENYQRLADHLYLGIAAQSFLLAGSATLLCLLIGYPLALFISRSGRWKNLYLLLVIVPFWISFLVRTYAWMFLLRDTGLINTVLEAAGLIRQPLPLLYNPAAVVLGLVYGYLPFMVLPVYAALERLDPALLEAAADLGAAPRASTLRVLLPLSWPGIRAGIILVFIPCLGAYLTPDLLGGGKAMMIGNLVQNQFTTARDWPFGAAMSLALMMPVALLLVVLLRRKGEELL